MLVGVFDWGFDVQQLVGFVDFGVSNSLMIMVGGEYLNVNVVNNGVNDLLIMGLFVFGYKVLMFVQVSGVNMVMCVMVGQLLVLQGGIDLCCEGVVFGDMFWL